MLNLLHEETSEIGKKIFCWMPRISIKEWCFCCCKYKCGVQRSNKFLIKYEQIKQGSYLDETNEKSGNYCK